MAYKKYLRDYGNGISAVSGAGGASIMDITSSGVNLYQSSNIVDIQTATASGLITRSAASWTQMTTMTLTTSNAYARQYLVTFSCEFYRGEEEEGAFRTQIRADSTQVGNTDMLVFTGFGDEVTGFSVSCVTPSLATGKVIDVRWRSDDFIDLNVTNRTLTILGIG